jgi:hypothetical protein
MPPRRANPTETEKRLDRIERAIAQLAHAVKVTGGWKPRHNGQDELAEILEEQQQALETRPHVSDETREKVNA